MIVFGKASVAIVLSLLSLSAQVSDLISEGQWFHQSLRTDESSSLSTGSGVIVAVVDSGVDIRHPDLGGSVLSGTDLTETGDGSRDTNGHGTAMAGLVAAHGRVKGLAPSAKVLPIRTSSESEGSADKLASGIRWAAEHGARVISVSRAAPEDDLLLRQEVESALAKDIVVVAAAGNAPEHRVVQYPAAIPGVIAVAGVDRNSSHSSTSVSGPEVVIAAPSENISSTGLNGTWQVATGTSDATAIVAGAVALVRARFPEMKATEVVRRLTATAVDKGVPGRDNDYGYGVLNLVGALTADLPGASSAPVATTGGATAPPMREGRGFPWWLIAVPAAIVVGFAVVRWRREKPVR